MLTTHGNLLALVRATADRYGWKVRAEFIDKEPGELYSKDAPGRGDIVLTSPDGAQSTFEYGLPEDEKEIRQVVFDTIEGLELDNNDRKRDKTVPLRRRV